MNNFVETYFDDYKEVLNSFLGEKKNQELLSQTINLLRETKESKKTIQEKAGK